MAYHLSVWLAGVTLLLPMVVFGLAWATIKRFYERREIRREQRRLYIAALLAGSLSTIAYTWDIGIGGSANFIKRLFPYQVLLALDRSIYAARAASIAAVVFLLIGRGPYRFPVFLATLWVTFQLWMHGSIIHRS